MAKIGHDAKALVFAKWSVCVKNYTGQNGAKNGCTITLELMCEKKKPSKKHLILEEREHFENGQKWQQRKGFSLCKMVSFGQKLKMPKRCEKRLHDHVRGVVCKNAFRKTPNIPKARAI